MKIALNGTALLSPLTGIGQYTYHLASGLQATPEIDIDIFYSMGWSKELRDRPFPRIGDIKSIARKLIPNARSAARFFQQRRFNKGMKANVADIYHEPNFLAFNFAGPTVITVHDLSWIRFPQTHPIERVRAMDKYFEPGLMRASRIITDSEFVKKELIDVFGIQPEKIQPILLGVESLFRPQTALEVQPVLSRYGLDYGSYLLAVGTLEPRKNLQLALRAFMQLPQRTRKRFPLILVGMKGWNTSALERQIEPLVHAGEIRQLGYLPREDLATITAGAVSLIYPSIYEGFGLPPLESMACGVPVICSNVSSLPEVIGDTGILINPDDEDYLAQTILNLLNNEQLRQKLSEQALLRSKKFTWDRCVKQTVSAYHKALG